MSIPYKFEMAPSQYPASASAETERRIDYDSRSDKRTAGNVFPEGALRRLGSKLVREWK
jgi:hypothetical protein